jgi:hypothetical protein
LVVFSSVVFSELRIKRILPSTDSGIASSANECENSLTAREDLLPLVRFLPERHGELHGKPVSSIPDNFICH